jgi:hypothetical protein
MSLVRITNITHRSFQNGFGVWFDNTFLEAGKWIDIPVERLPKGWERLTNTFDFNFLPVPEQPPVSSQQPSSEDIRDVIRQELGGLVQGIQSSLQDVVKNIPLMATSNQPSSIPNSDVPIFIPEVENSIIESRIQVESSTNIGGLSKQDIKARFSKIKHGS